MTRSVRGAIGVRGPLSLSHLNGAMHNSAKCSLMDKLEPMGHTVYYAVGQCCFIYTAEHGQVQRHQVHELECGHEEADTRLLFHAQYVSQLDTD